MKFISLACLFSILFFFQNAYAVKIYSTGSTQDFKTEIKQIICLAGGGDDDLWAAGWKALLHSANGGDITIIRATGDRGDYESWIYNDEGHHNFPRVNSVKTIVIENASDANRLDVEQIILKSELIFFAGGDQTLYINWFRHSKLSAAVNYMMNMKKVSLAGTSAGMALLAGIDFKAEFNSPNPENNLVSAEDVMNDPTGSFIDLDRSVFTPPFLKNVITDTHFSQRDRQARLMGFMARAIYNKYDAVDYKTIRGIGADEGTAVCYNRFGKAKVFGDGHAYFLQPFADVERIQVGQTLDWYHQRQAVSAYVIKGSDKGSAEFNLVNWLGTGGFFQSWWIDGNSNIKPIFGID